MKIHPVIAGGANHANVLLIVNLAGELEMQSCRICVHRGASGPPGNFRGGRLRH